MDILRGLYHSDEAQKAHVKIPWLQRALIRNRLLRFAMLGLKPRLFGAQKQLQIGQRLYTLEKAIASLSQQVTAELQKISEVVEAQAAGTPNRLPKPPASSITAPSTDAVILGKSLVAKRVLKELQDGLKKNDLPP